MTFIETSFSSGRPLNFSDYLVISIAFSSGDEKRCSPCNDSFQPRPIDSQMQMKGFFVGRDAEF